MAEHRARTGLRPHLVGDAPGACVALRRWLLTAILRRPLLARQRPRCQRGSERARSFAGSSDSAHRRPPARRESSPSTSGAGARPRRSAHGQTSSTPTSTRHADVAGVRRRVDGRLGWRGCRSRLLRAHRQGPLDRPPPEVTSAPSAGPDEGGPRPLRCTRHGSHASPDPRERQPGVTGAGAIPGGPWQTDPTQSDRYRGASWSGTRWFRRRASGELAAWGG